MELDRNLTPPPPGPRIDFWTPKNVKPELVVMVSRWVWAHYIHWIGNCTAPCTQSIGLDGQVTRHCEYCKAQKPTRWKGYLHVRRVNLHQLCFLCLTPNSGFAVMEAFKDEKNLRGLFFDVNRASDSATSELLVRPNTLRARCVVEVEELDPGPYLDTVFRRRKRLP